MKVTRINYLFKFFTVRDKYYTFKQEEHEIVLLKKLDDNKISYNSQIYDNDFFEYYKLEAFVQKIYDARDFELKNWFKDYYKESIKQGWQGEVINRDPWDNLNWENLTIEQYNKLVECYKYDFYYPFKYDLLNIDLEIPPLTKISSLFNEWFYVVGWKSIKPVYPTFKIIGIHTHYEDEYHTIEKKKDLVFRHEYDPFEEGTRFIFESYPEYDEQKKFNEFDINCKTNTYHMRYKAYNEIFWKDYPEIKKFKTDLIHINYFTEEEIQLNYENMINKEKSAMEKWNYVMHDGKNYAAVEEFFLALEALEINREFVYYKKDSWFYEEREDTFTNLAKSIELEIEEIFTNPRNLLIMPLLDIYFEIYRSKGWYTGDNTFNELHHFSNKYFKYLYYFDFTYERYYMCIKNKDIIFDYIDIEDDDYEDELDDEHDILQCAILFFIWLFGVSFYTYCCWFMYYNYHDNMFDIVPEYLNTVTNYVINKPKMYYGLELRVPRTYYAKRRRYSKPWNIHYRFNPVKRPTNFFYDSTYYIKEIRELRKLRGIDNPVFWKASLLDWYSHKFSHEDYGLVNLDYKLRMFSRRHGIYRFRFYKIEPPVSEDDQLIVPKIKRFIKFIQYGLLDILKFLAHAYMKYIVDDQRYWTPERTKAHYEELARIAEEKRAAIREAERIQKEFERSQKKWYNITKYF